MNTNTRVVVCLNNYQKYTIKAAISMDGKTGTIIEVKENKYLIQFDIPANPWWENQLPVNSFWFDREELYLINQTY